ncbi:MAG: hypothetical protein WCD81_09945 [Candidatus Bathyarchaeia archaeon]
MDRSNVNSETVFEDDLKNFAKLAVEMGAVARELIFILTGDISCIFPFFYHVFWMERERALIS